MVVSPTKVKFSKSGVNLRSYRMGLMFGGSRTLPAVLDMVEKKVVRWIVGEDRRRHGNRRKDLWLAVGEGEAQRFWVFWGADLLASL